MQSQPGVPSGRVKCTGFQTELEEGDWPTTTAGVEKLRANGAAALRGFIKCKRFKDTDAARLAIIVNLGRAAQEWSN